MRKQDLRRGPYGEHRLKSQQVIELSTLIIIVQLQAGEYDKQYTCTIYEKFEISISNEPADKLNSDYDTTYQLHISSQRKAMASLEMAALTELRGGS